jgi:hypothetical protein
MFDYLDACPDLVFLSFFVALLVVIYAAEWILDLVGRGDKR